jgi:hypothetical protein
VIARFEGGGVVFRIDSGTIIDRDKPIVEQPQAAWTVTCCGRLSDGGLQVPHSSCHVRITVNKTSPSSVNSLCLYPNIDRRNVTLKARLPTLSLFHDRYGRTRNPSFLGPRWQTRHSSTTNFAWSFCTSVDYTSIHRDILDISGGDSAVKGNV